MISSVSSLPYFSYLDQLQGKASSAPIPSATAPAASSHSTSSSLVSSLLGKGGFAPSVLGLLQENESGFDSVSTIFGGKTVTNGVAKLYANLYNNSAASALQETKLENPKIAVKASPASFNLIADSTKASTAYNQTLQQNAATALAQGKAQTVALIS